MSHSLASYANLQRRRPAARAAKRAEFIEINQRTAWDVSGELWVFEQGAQIAIGPATCLDADPQTISSRLAVELIRAGKAEAASIKDLDEPDRGPRDLVMSDLDIVPVPAEDAA